MDAFADSRAPGTITTIYDDALGIVRIKAKGFWNTEQVDRSFEELASIRQRRWRGGGLRVLVDRRDTVVQSAETAHRLQERTETFYQLGDRVAVVVDHSLAKLQLRRVLDGATHSLFISERAAMLWLKAGELFES